MYLGDTAADRRAARAVSREARQGERETARTQREMARTDRFADRFAQRLREPYTPSPEIPGVAPPSMPPYQQALVEASGSAVMPAPAPIPMMPENGGDAVEPAASANGGGIMPLLLGAGLLMALM